MTMNGAVKQLDEHLRNFVRASSSIASYHSAVEEVILNSIDAGSRTIGIILDVQSCSFEVSDNGRGVDLANFEAIGEWNRTSKTDNQLHPLLCSNERDPSYGMKGEALAAIRALACLKIESKPQLATISDTVFTKQFNGHKAAAQVATANSSQHSILHNQDHGTVVSVYDLFRNLPVRRKVVRAEVEVSYIKEFIQNMSILHHSISWTLSTGRLVSHNGSIGAPSSSAGQQCVLLRLPGQVSVAKRFIGFHGLQNMLNMQEVCLQTGCYRVEGFLSPPLPQRCTHSREAQHLYLNGRWLRNSDRLSAVLDATYGRLLGALSGSAGGMPARHAAEHSTYRSHDCASASGTSSSFSSTAGTSKQGGTHPCFVLQVSCPDSEYDILSDPDKSVAVFRNEVSALRCVEEVVNRLLREHWPEHHSELVHLVYAESASRSGVTAMSSGATSTQRLLRTGGPCAVEGLVEDSAAELGQAEGSPVPTRQLECYAIVKQSVRTTCATLPSTTAVASTLTTQCTGTAAEAYRAAQFPPFPQVQLSVASPQSALFASVFFSGPSTPLSAQKKPNSAAVTAAGDGMPTASGSVLQALTASPFADSPYSPYAYKSTRFDHACSSGTPEHLRNSAVKRMVTAVAGKPHAQPVPHNFAADGASEGDITHIYSEHKRPRLASSENILFPDCGDTGAKIANNAAANKQEYTVPCAAEVGVNVFRLSFSPVHWTAQPSEPQLDRHQPVLVDAPTENGEGYGEYQYSGVCEDRQDDNQTAFDWSAYAARPPSPPEATAFAGRQDPLQKNRSFQSPVHSPPEGEFGPLRSLRSPESPRQPARHSAEPPALLTAPISFPRLDDISGDIVSADADAEAGVDAMVGDSMVGDASACDDHGSRGDAATGITTQRSAGAVFSTDTGQYLQHTLHRRNSSAATGAPSSSGSTQQEPRRLPVPSVSSAAGLAPVASALPYRAEQVRLSKTTLRDHLRCVGQADRKFIVARTCCCCSTETPAVSTAPSGSAATDWCPRCGNSSLLLVLDQHAADERVQYEALSAALYDALRTSTGSGGVDGVVGVAAPRGSGTLGLSARESEMLLSRASLLDAWGFGYTVHDEGQHAASHTPQGEEHTTASTTTAAGHNAAAVTVHTVPVILGEPLLAADLREFVQHIAAHRELPDSLLSPPAVQRIVASRACHSAVKFGDALSAAACAGLLQRLMRTELPFQCAHGRPSMAPVLDMRELYLHKRRELGSLR